MRIWIQLLPILFQPLHGTIYPYMGTNALKYWFALNIMFPKTCFHMSWGSPLTSLQLSQFLSIFLLFVCFPVYFYNVFLEVWL